LFTFVFAVLLQLWYLLILRVNISLLTRGVELEISNNYILDAFAKVLSIFHCLCAEIPLILLHFRNCLLCSATDFLWKNAGWQSFSTAHAQQRLF